MNQWVWSLTICLFLTTNAMCAFDEEGVTFRTFTSADGQAIEARIQRYDATKDRVFVERKGGQKVWVNPSVFSEKDIAYIKEWVVVDSILSERKLLISVNECKKNEFGTSPDPRRGVIACYEVCLENRTGQDIKDLSIDYRTFIEVEGIKGREDQEGKRSGGTLTVDLIKAGESKTVRTKDFEITDYYTDPKDFSYKLDENSYSASAPKMYEDKTVGIWLKIYSPELEGTSFARDHIFPRRAEQKKLEWLDEKELHWEYVKERGPALNEQEMKEWILDALSRMEDEDEEHYLTLIDDELEFILFESRCEMGLWPMLISLAYMNNGNGLSGIWLIRSSYENTMIYPQLLAMELDFSASPTNSRTIPNLRSINEESLSPAESALLESIDAAQAAEEGFFDVAAQTQRQALNALPQNCPDWIRSMYKERIKLYESGKKLVLKKGEPREWYLSVTVDGQCFSSSPELSTEYPPLIKKEFKIEVNDSEDEEESRTLKLFKEGL